MTYWAKNHECATCEFWSGPRETKKNPCIVEAKAGVRGICMGHNRRFRGKEVSCGYRVLDGCYVRWKYLSEK